MIIIVPGDYNKLEERRFFTCPVCGCAFSASKREYIPEYARNDVVYRAICPFCGKAVYGGVLAGEGGDDDASSV